MPLETFVERTTPSSLRRECVLVAMAAAFVIPTLWWWWEFLEPVAIYDSVFYLDMASNGVFDNPNLVAPFAYRFSVPLLVELVCRLTGGEVETVFALFTGTAAGLLLVAVYALSRSVGASVRVAVFALGATVFSFVLFRFHLYWYVLVDIEAYLLLLLAMWFLWTGRTWHCLAVSLVGLLFKEFLGIPGLIAGVTIACDQRPPIKQRMVLSAVAVASLFAFAAVPRLAMPVVESFQSFDLLHPWVSMAQHFGSSARVLRVGYSLCLVSFPLLLLLSATRARRLVDDLSGVGAQLVIFYSMLCALAMLGGAGIPRFMSYSLPWLVLLMSRLRPVPSATELMVAFGAVFLFNRPWVPLPNPGLNIFAFVNFYGGHTGSSAFVMFWRTLEMCGWIAVLNVLRVALTRPEAATVRRVVRLLKPAGELSS